MGVLISGVAGVQALVSQSSFRMDDLSRRIHQLQQRQGELELQEAELSSPRGIADEAKRLGLQLPGPPIVLKVPNTGAAGERPGRGGVAVTVRARPVRRAPPRVPAKKPAAASTRSRTRPLRPRPPARRLIALLAVMGLGLGGILFRLVVLQVGHAEAYQDLAIGQRLKSITLPAERGSILDRNGHPCVMSMPAKTVFADPTLVDNAAAEAKIIGSILHLPKRHVERQLQPATLPDGRRRSTSP